MEAKDVKNLMEAYASLYTESNEEEFETWVNALVEEGYDLSEYTWDDMYEIYMEEVEQLDEKKVEPNEKLPSGKTPLEKMQRKRDYHAANYMLRQREPGVGRNDQAATSHFNRASTIDTVKKSAESGEEPHKDPKWKNTIAARRRKRSPGEVPNERPGGLRAKETKAGGHRTLVRKEEFEGDLFDYILEHLVAEGYADTNENALVIMANMSEEWKQSILEEKKPIPNVAIRKIGRAHV